MSETEQEETQRPLTIAMVVDTSGNRGNGTSNSALQWAEELKRKDAMLWVQRCNNIRNRAEEIVLNEMVYI